MIVLSDIVIGARHRKDLGDIAALAASIADVGLLHAIVVTPDNRLIAGAAPGNEDEPQVELSIDAANIAGAA